MAKTGTLPGQDVPGQDVRGQDACGIGLALSGGQVRKKLLQLLQMWRAESPSREFAFIHLFMNLKDRADSPRVPTEYIPGLARIRTDLDQFGAIEREALMYHGYTLIDAQLGRHCQRLVGGRQRPPMRVPHLFSEAEPSGGQSQAGSFQARRQRIRRVLEIGSQKLFMLRSFRKYPLKGGIALLLSGLLPLAGFYALWVNRHIEWLTLHLGMPVLNWLAGLVPSGVSLLFSTLGIFRWPLTQRGFTEVLAFLLTAYVFLFISYVFMRVLVRRWDRRDYEKLSGGQACGTHWRE